MSLYNRLTYHNWSTKSDRSPPEIRRASAVFGVGWIQAGEGLNPQGHGINRINQQMPEG